MNYAYFVGTLSILLAYGFALDVREWRRLPKVEAYEVGMIVSNPFGRRVRIVGTDNSPVDGRCRGFWAKTESNARVFISLHPSGYWRHAA